MSSDGCRTLDTKNGYEKFKSKRFASAYVETRNSRTIEPKVISSADLIIVSLDHICGASSSDGQLNLSPTFNSFLLAVQLQNFNFKTASKWLQTRTDSKRHNSNTRKVIFISNLYKRHYFRTYFVYSPLRSLIKFYLKRLS